MKTMTKGDFWFVVATVAYLLLIVLVGKILEPFEKNEESEED
jgi:hypothetical protein